MGCEGVETHLDGPSFRFPGRTVDSTLLALLLGLSLLTEGDKFVVDLGVCARAAVAAALTASSVACIACAIGFNVLFCTMKHV